jgi:hypothetical protein
MGSAVAACVCALLAALIGSALDRRARKIREVTAEKTRRLKEEREPFMAEALREVDAFLPLTPHVGAHPGDRLCWCCQDNVVPPDPEPAPAVRETARLLAQAGVRYMEETDRFLWPDGTVVRPADVEAHGSDRAYWMGREREALRGLR